MTPCIKKKRKGGKEGEREVGKEESNGGGTKGGGRTDLCSRFQNQEPALNNPH